MNTFRKRWFATFLVLILACGTATVGGIAHDQQRAGGAATTKPKYLLLIAQRCRKTYFPLQDFEFCKAVASFQLSDGNSISNIKVLKHPISAKGKRPVKLADDALVQALESLKPLPAPPPDMKPPLTVYVVFDGRNKGPMRITATTNVQDALNDK